MLRSHGLVLSEVRALPDHFDFSGQPLSGLTAARILVTEKDAVKCAGIASLANDGRLWVVPIEATINGPLAEKIVEKLRGQPTA
jgi:tetraacyldisaccharide 4'-kinase